MAPPAFSFRFPPTSGQLIKLSLPFQQMCHHDDETTLQLPEVSLDSSELLRKCIFKLAGPLGSLCFYIIVHIRPELFDVFGTCWNTGSVRVRNNLCLIDFPNCTRPQLLI